MVPPPPLPSRLACSVCEKTYRRSSHLRRHEGTHSQITLFRCPGCSKSFGRQDVCRKHMMNCPNKIGNDPFPPTRRGQKPRACDACFNSKLACDAKQPCARCLSRHQPCTYLRLQQTLAVDLRGQLEGPSPSISSVRDIKDEPLAFSFLLDVTNPHAESRVKPFSTVSRRDEKEASLDNTLTPSSFNEADAFNGFMVHDHAFLQGFEEDYLDDVWGPVDPNLGPYVSPVPDTNPIVDQIKLQEALRNIITELEDFDTSLVSSNKIGWIRFDPGLARKILVAENLRTFIACFFRYSHPEIPIVHRPSFEEEASTPGLLLALFLCGSMHAAPTDDALSARRFFDIAEEYAFHKLATYVAAYDRQVAPVQAKEFHQTFLAALLMHYLQFPMNKIAVRERNRDQRLSVLISTVRKMGFTNIKHIPPSDERFSWEQFIFQETQIRIANWTLLAAWQQSAIFHHPCSMTILEMACDFPCLEELWEARNAVEFGTILTVQGESVVSSQSSSMRECFNALMDDKWCGPQGFPQRLHSLQDMQFLIQAIYCSILSARFMGTLTLSKPGFERAIARWQELWDSIVEQSWVCASFASRHSLEFLLLSRKLLEASSSTDQDSAYLSGVAHSSTDELHDFLKRALDLNS